MRPLACSASGLARKICPWTGEGLPTAGFGVGKNWRSGSGGVSLALMAACGTELRFQQQAVNRLTRRRPVEQEALHLVATGEPQQHALVFGLDAFNKHTEIQRASQRHDSLDDEAAVFRFAQGSDEAAIDLQLIEREP